MQLAVRILLSACFCIFILSSANAQQPIPHEGCTEGQIIKQADGFLYQCHDNKWVRLSAAKISIVGATWGLPVHMCEATAAVRGKCQDQVTCAPVATIEWVGVNCNGGQQRQQLLVNSVCTRDGAVLPNSEKHLTIPMPQSNVLNCADFN